MTFSRNRIERERALIKAMTDIQLTIFIADEQERAAALMRASKSRKLSLKARRDLDHILDEITFAQKCWLER